MKQVFVGNGSPFLMLLEGASSVGNAIAFADAA
jgi:hypothetical protein